jgi:hypothetical protein
MSRAGNVDHVKIILIDDTVEVNIDEVEAGSGAPVA